MPVLLLFVICRLKDKLIVQPGLLTIEGSLTCVSGSDLLEHRCSPVASSRGWTMPTTTAI